MAANRARPLISWSSSSRATSPPVPSLWTARSDTIHMESALHPVVEGGFCIIVVVCLGQVDVMTSDLITPLGDSNVRFLIHPIPT